jgi:hypothetical protein
MSPVTATPEDGNAFTATAEADAGAGAAAGAAATGRAPPA